jgi:hypothetical protein
MTQYTDIICKINHIESLYPGNPAVQHTAPHSSLRGLPTKHWKPNDRKVRIDPAFAPLTEELYPPIIGFKHEPSRLSATTASVSIITPSECGPLVINHNHCVSLRHHHRSPVVAIWQSVCFARLRAAILGR